MKKYFILLICVLFVGCSTLSKEERLALETKIDHEECLSLGFEENTEAYGGCRLTLKSIRAQDKTTQAINRNGLDNRFCRRWYCW
jgi:hypothetical protein|tara:strand:- start:573 stop:827 length:255 start_codon:yes stop_codon:yes gene_type:complete